MYKIIDAVWINADKVRSEANDWDFSPEGRKRQANRMKNLANSALSNNKHVIADFVCPTPQTRKDFDADFIIWMDTIKKGRFDDTNKMFIAPKRYDYRVTEKKAELIAVQIAKKINEKKDE